jgi:uncharacterized protein YprB with RNaseH-like and TPR domain
MKKPRILFFDIESTPNLAFIWGLGKQHVGYEQIAKERKISCISYKFSDEKEVKSLKMNMDQHDINLYDDEADKEMLIEFSKIYATADLAVAHNGISFDIGTIRARLLKHGLTDITPIVFDDTYIKSKSLRTNSHKLDYLSRYLNIGTKAAHPYSLWTRIMLGDKKALKETVKYCEQDVKLLEKVYNKLLPFFKSNLSRAVFGEDPTKCANCGGKLQKNGFKLTHSVKRQRFQCSKCGRYHIGGKNLLEDSTDYPK